MTQAGMVPRRWRRFARVLAVGVLAVAGLAIAPAASALGIRVIAPA